MNMNHRFFREAGLALLAVGTLASLFQEADEQEGQAEHKFFISFNNPLDQGILHIFKITRKFC